MRPVTNCLGLLALVFCSTACLGAKEGAATQEVDTTEARDVGETSSPDDTSEDTGVGEDMRASEDTGASEDTSASEDTNSVDVGPEVRVCVTWNETCVEDTDCCEGVCITRSSDVGVSRARCAWPVPEEYGVEDGPCYLNETCNGGLVCDLGTCVAPPFLDEDPGGNGALCFADGTCKPSYFCNQFGKCEPTEPFVCVETQAACDLDGAVCCSSAVACTVTGDGPGYCCNRDGRSCASSNECCAGLECVTWEGNPRSRCEPIE